MIPGHHYVSKVCNYPLPFSVKIYESTDFRCTVP